MLYIDVKEKVVFDDELKDSNSSIIKASSKIDRLLFVMRQRTPKISLPLEKHTFAKIGPNKKRLINHQDVKIRITRRYIIHCRTGIVMLCNKPNYNISTVTISTSSLLVHVV